MQDQMPIEMLKSDHRKVEELFNDFESSSADDIETRKSAISQACQDLKVHARLEEELFYPEVQNFSDEGKAFIDQSLQDHQIMKDLISEIENLGPEDSEFENKAKELKENVLRHVQMEESKVFPFVEENLGDKMGPAMSAKMMANKAKYRVGAITEDM